MSKLKLTEVYTELIQEGENEDQARSVLRKRYENEESVDHEIEKFKNLDPTSQNKYMPILARLMVHGGIENYNNLGTIVEGLQWLEEQYSVKLQFSKKKGEFFGYFFNKSIEEYGVEAGDGISATQVKAIGEKAVNDKERLQNLKQSKKMGKDDDESTPKVDGKNTNRVYKGENIEVYAGKGQRACIEHSKGTDWCIGEPKSGHYTERRSEGSSFYFVYDKTPESGDDADKVVVEVVADPVSGEEVEEFHVYDRRNEQDHVTVNDGEVEFTSPYDYFEYLEDIEPGFDPTGVFQPIPMDREEEIMKRVKTEDFENIVGEYEKLNDGTIVDLTLEWIKEHGLNDDDYDEIKGDPVAKKFLKDYIWTALMKGQLFPTTTVKVRNDFGPKLFDKYAKKMYKEYNGDIEKVIDNASTEYLMQISQDTMDKLMMEYLESADDAYIPDSLFDRVSTDVLVKNLEKFIKNGQLPPLSHFIYLSDEKVNEYLPKVSDRVKKMGNSKEIKAYEFDHLLKSIKKLEDDHGKNIEEEVKKKIVEDIMSEGLYTVPIFDSPVFKEGLSDEQLREYASELVMNENIMMDFDFMKMIGLDEIGFKLTADQVIKLAKYHADDLGDPGSADDDLDKIIRVINKYKEKGFLDQDAYDKALEELKDEFS